MSLLKYLKLQPIDPQEDGSVSDLDYYEQDEAFDLTQDPDGEALANEWAKIEKSFHNDIHADG